MTAAPVLGWHFCATRDGVPVLRDGSVAAGVGDTERHTGPLVLCESGLHASVRAIDALAYAPDLWVRRVECGGAMLRGDDKLVCAERQVLASIDATEIIRAWAMDEATRAVETHCLHCGVQAVESWAARWVSGEDRTITAATDAVEATATAAAATAAAAWAARLAARATAATAEAEAARLAARATAATAEAEAAHWAVVGMAAWASVRDEQNARLEAALLAAIEAQP